MIKTWQEYAEIHEHLMGPIGLPAKLSLMQREIDQLREALAKQEQDMPKIGCVNHDCDKCKEQGEPVAWIEHHKGGDNLNWEEVNHPYAKATPLYTTPQQRKPLTDEQTIIDILNKHFECVDDEYVKRAAKEIAAHSIKE